MIRLNGASKMSNEITENDNTKEYIRREYVYI